MAAVKQTAAVAASAMILSFIVTFLSWPFLAARLESALHTVRLSFGFDGVPDHRGNVVAAERLHLPDAGGRRDIDLGDVRSDDVDAGKNEAAAFKFRPEARADFAVARR